MCPECSVCFGRERFRVMFEKDKVDAAKWKAPVQYASKSPFFHITNSTFHTGFSFQIVGFVVVNIMPTALPIQIISFVQLARKERLKKVLGLVILLFLTSAAWLEQAQATNLP